jgi:hypothetical protein
VIGHFERELEAVLRKPSCGHAGVVDENVDRTIHCEDGFRARAHAREIGQQST